MALNASGGKGRIEGVVTDPGGVEIPGVRVVVVEEESRAKHSAITSETGHYSVGSLSPGIYRVSASRPLFKDAHSDEVTVEADRSVTVNLVLNLGEMSEVVTAPPADLHAVSRRTCYVDSEHGDDGNDGVSPERPWQSLEKINSETFGPGDRILFKAGSRFSGQLKPQGSGSEKEPIRIAMYGTGDRPLIAAGGQFGEALLLENQDYWEVSDLELTNNGPTRELFRNGIRIRVWNYETMRHIHLRNLSVHDVNGSLKKGEGEGYGILLENGGEEVRSRFDGILVEACHLARTDRNGICGRSSYRPDQARAFPNLNVVIRKNLLEDIGGDGIKVWGCNGAIVEHNVIRGARTRCDDYAAGIWPWASDNTLIQFNEVSGVKGKKDGQAFDSDAHTTNTIFQYNYSHDNEGGFMLICCFDNSGTIVRYNISQNDQTRIFHMAGSNEKIQIYNNVFYIPEGDDVHLFLWTGRESNWTRNVQIFNNIFYAKGTGRNSSGEKRKPINDGTFVTEPGFGGSSEIEFERNLLFGNFEGLPQEWKKMTVDPELVGPGTGGYGITSLDGYKLKPGSPCIGAGRTIRNNGGRDFWGTPLPSDKSPSIGVYEVITYQDAVRGQAHLPGIPSSSGLSYLPAMDRCGACSGRLLQEPQCRSQGLLQAVLHWGR